MRVFCVGAAVAAILACAPAAHAQRPASLGDGAPTGQMGVQLYDWSQYISNGAGEVNPPAPTTVRRAARAGLPATCSSNEHQERRALRLSGRPVPGHQPGDAAEHHRPAGAARARRLRTGCASSRPPRQHRRGQLGPGDPGGSRSSARSVIGAADPPVASATMTVPGRAERSRSCSTGSVSARSRLASGRCTSTTTRQSFNRKLHRRRRAQERVGGPHGPHRPALREGADRPLLGSRLGVCQRRRDDAHALVNQLPEPPRAPSTSRTASTSDAVGRRRPTCAQLGARRGELRAALRRGQEPRQATTSTSTTRSRSATTAASTRSPPPTDSLGEPDRAPRHRCAGTNTPKLHLGARRHTAAAANQVPVKVTNDRRRPARASRPRSPTIAAERRRRRQRHARPTSRSSARTARSPTAATRWPRVSACIDQRRLQADAHQRPRRSRACSSPRTPTTRLERVPLAATSTGDAHRRRRRRRRRPCWR